MRNKVILLGTVTLLLFLCLAVPQTTVVYAATDYTSVNLTEYYGASTTSCAIYNSLFESDPDIKTLITDNSLSLWGTDVSLEGLTLDYTEFSYGKHTTDWTGTVGSTTDLAYGGLEYWCPNVTSSPGTTSSGNAQVISDPTIATPASGGYKLTATITFDDETTENSDVDGSGRNFEFGSVGEFSGVDLELNANSYVYMNYAFTLSVLNTTAIPRLGVYWIIRTAGGADVAITYGYASGVTTDTAWEDSSTSASESSLFDQTDEDVVRWEVNATSTSEYEYVGFWKVDDLLSKSAAYTSDTPAQIKEWGYYAQSTYSSANSGGTVGTLKVKNLLFVDNVEDLALFEKTTKSDSATKESNNFPNNTAQAVTPSDKYELVDGFDFYIPTNIPINRLTLSAYTVVYTPTNYHSVYDRTNSIVQRKAVVDANPPTDERITDPSTLYWNISSLNVNYQITNIYDTSVESDNAVWDGDDLRSSTFSCVDKDSSPTLDELSDIYKDMSVIDPPLRFGATNFNTVSDAKTIYIMYYATVTDIALIDVGGTGDGGAGLSIPGILLTVQQNWASMLFWGIIALIIALAFGYFAGVLPFTKRDDKRAKKTSTWVKLGLGILFLFFLVLFLSPFFT